MVNVPCPCVWLRKSVEYPNVSARGTSATITAISAVGFSLETMIPRRLVMSPEIGTLELAGAFDFHLHNRFQAAPAWS